MTRKEASASFLKKRSKKLFIHLGSEGYRRGRSGEAIRFMGFANLHPKNLMDKVFLLLFFQKKKRLLILLLLTISALAQAAPRSGYDDSGPQVRTMQDDDTQNPAFLWIQQGESLWSQPAGTANKSCADCHQSMRGVAASYPAWDPATAAPITLAQRINHCRTTHQGAAKLPQESDPLLALTALVALQSRGQPLAIDETGPLKPFIEAGRTLFNTRQGQLNLSCANCHEERAGRHLGGALIPEGHANGYPQYRLEWQKLGSFPRRLRACLLGVRAEPLPPDAPDATNIELYLATRARGLTVETPAVRP
jgi:sulfur-oxidizing protein SoxA